MDHKHRKTSRQERARVAREGVGFRIVHGAEATPRDLEAIHALYLQTFAEYGNHPALTLGFIGHLAETLPRALVLVLAEHHGEPIAGELDRKSVVTAKRVAEPVALGCPGCIKQKRHQK